MVLKNSFENKYINISGKRAEQGVAAGRGSYSDTLKSGAKIVWMPREKSNEETDKSEQEESEASPGL